MHYNRQDTSFFSQFKYIPGKMFKRAFRSQDQSQSQSQNRVDKSSRVKKPSSAKEHVKAKVSKLQNSMMEHEAAPAQPINITPSPIVTLTVGREGRLFAAHEDVLSQSPFFEAACSKDASDAMNKRISLPDEEPEIFSAVLEYLYKGDYYPRLVHNRHRNSWELEDRMRAPQKSPPTIPDYGGGQPGAGSDAAVYLSSVGAEILRDTVIYCAADRYGLEELKRLALRKQGLHAGIDVGTILRSAQYAYANTPDSDSRLRAHYLALIIRCRKTFKRSGTMQAEMEAGGSKLFFDLFVAMCNHLDDVIDVTNGRSPKTV
jgi:hypothetical protein